jgi:hypothetical protein
MKSLIQKALQIGKGASTRCGLDDDARYKRDEIRVLTESGTRNADGKRKDAGENGETVWRNRET